MAVIVKNMNMPRCCSECELCYDMIACIVTWKHFYRGNTPPDTDNERLPDCPLIPITEEQVKEILNAV